MVIRHGIADRRLKLQVPFRQVVLPVAMLRQIVFVCLLDRAADKRMGSGRLLLVLEMLDRILVRHHDWRIGHYRIDLVSLGEVSLKIGGFPERDIRSTTPKYSFSMFSKFRGVISDFRGDFG